MSVAADRGKGELMSRNSKTITGSIQPKDGKLYAVINLYVEGKRKPKWIDTGFKERNGKRQANSFLQEELAQRNTEMNRGQNASFNGTETLFVDFLKSWLQTKSAGSKPIQSTTYRSYKDIIDGRVNRYFGIERELTLSELEPDDFEDYYASMYQDGLTTCTALHHHRVMYQALKYAVIKRVLRYNVLDAVETPADSKYVADYYNVDEAKEILRHAKGQLLYLPILLSTYYGLRRSEVLGMRWSNIDFKAGTISINRKIIVDKEDGVRVLRDSEELKTKKSRRTLPLLDFVAMELEEARAKQDEYRAEFKGSVRYDHKYDDHVCVNQEGHLTKPDYISSSFKPFLEKVGMRPIRFHDLRHTCASLLVMGRVPIFNVAQWLGHSSSRTTEKIYAHIDAMLHDETANVIGNLLNNNEQLTKGNFQEILTNNNHDKITAAFCQLDPFAQRKMMDALLESDK